jgi:hypothetical protein
LSRKQLIGLAALLATLPFADHSPASADEIRACKFVVKARCASGEARVTFADGAAIRIEIEIHWCAAQRGRPGYDCTIDSSRRMKQAWSAR